MCVGVTAIPPALGVLHSKRRSRTPLPGQRVSVFLLRSAVEKVSRSLPLPSPVDPVVSCDLEKFLFVPGKGVELDDPQHLERAAIPIPV